MNSTLITLRNMNVRTLCYDVVSCPSGLLPLRPQGDAVVYTALS